MIVSIYVSISFEGEVAHLAAALLGLLERKLTLASSEDQGSFGGAYAADASFCVRWVG